jgi:D-3-phosphoglycerate dehydrogenase / 2-oxoglutarate reductase
MEIKMHKEKVIIDVAAIHKDGLKVFEPVEDIETVVYYKDRPLTEVMADARGILVGLSTVDAAVIESAPNLKIIAKHGVGYDNIDVAAATKRNIPVAVTPYANNMSVAEYTVGVMLALSKKLYPSSQALKTGAYGGLQDFTGIDLWGRTIGIIGMGRIGSEVARICRLAFNMTVLAYDPYVTEAYLTNTGARPVENLEELLKPSDYVTVHCLLSPETKGIIGEKEMGMMKKSAYLINSARGGIINEEALVKALDDGQIQGAAIDATILEPPGADHPLVTHDKILVTPHIAANSDEAMSRMASMAAQEIVRVLSGEKPFNIVNPEIYQ